MKPKSTPASETPREKFLIAMYSQLMNDINRHLTGTWQPVAVLITSVALLGVSKEINPTSGVLSLDILSAPVLLLCTWALAHVIDASNWYNRNLVIIGNIERQFLKPSDAQMVEFYFLQHRSTNKMISYLRIQFHLALGVAAIVLIFHFAKRIVPTCCELGAPLELGRGLPYLVALLCVCYLNLHANDAEEKYQEFVGLSPGKAVTPLPNASVGHGGSRTFLQTLKLALQLRRPPRRSNRNAAR